MLVSYNWVREFVAIDISPDELSHRLTMAGLEVSNLVEVGAMLHQIRVAQVEDIAPHPDAQRLSVCRIFDGKERYSVVCGAKNMAAGDKVAFAPVGASLPNGLTIEAARIRGVASEGMLCSEEELKLEEKSTGIMILPSELELGKDLASALLLKDWVLEIELTPNRADCLSVVGIAREVAALLDTHIRLPHTEFPETEEDVRNFINVTIESPEFCPRYTARYVSDITIKPSPLWMRRRLEECGFRSINNVVDVTNYILLEWGQPLHAFDYSLLDGRRIVVKSAKQGDAFITLDEKERSLDDQTLMICDASKYVAIGGIMGGLNTGVAETTRTVLLESAYFSPPNILRTSKKLGIKTEASIRFEKGVNPEGVVPALNRAAQLIALLSGGKVTRGIFDVHPNPPGPPPKVAFDPRKINVVLGTTLSPETILSYLERLDIRAESKEPHTWVATIPPHRGDLKEDVDLMEEVARIHGYEHIPVTLPTLSVPNEEALTFFNQGEKVRTLLADSGFVEVITYSFIAPESIEALQTPVGHPFRECIAIANPLSREQSIMRTTLLPGLLKTVSVNHNYQNLNLKIFEFGRTFLSKGSSPLPEERNMLGGLICGLRTEEAWNQPSSEVDFYDLKGIVENILQTLDIKGVSFQAAHEIPYLHPGIASQISINGMPAGVIGEVHPHVLDNFEISKRIFIFEIDFGKMFNYCAKVGKKAKPLPKFPPVYRDMALIVDVDTENKIIEDSILDAHVPYLEEVRVFDLYQGDPIPTGKKSLAYRMKFQAQGQSLTDEEVNGLYGKILSHLKATVKAELRK